MMKVVVSAVSFSKNIELVSALLNHFADAVINSEGKRYLKGCYIDHDSTEGKLRHLERKFNLKWKK